ncbi:MAG: methyl-accepting chemotaxis protein, partial [Stigonema ocellatum SAG 48.90 = DSM 106950]|nr:methyl-accepting chemotaxis protein [Stigonema ocellatum SAG 48.90 = DSM 106950]
MLNKIANRFLIGYSIPLAFLIVQGLTTAFMSQKVFDSQNVISRLQATRQEFEQTSYEISRMLRSARGYALFPKDQSFKTIFNAGYESFNQHAQALRESTIIPQHEDIRNTLITPQNTLIAEGNKLHDIFQEAFNLIDNNKLVEANQRIDINKSRNIDTMRQQFNLQVEAMVNDRNRELQQAQQFMVTVVWITTALAILSTIIVGLRIGLPIGRQLPQVVASAEQIAQGNLTQTVVVTQDKTELGQILAAFHHMTKSLNSLISQTQKSGIQITRSTTQIAAAGKQLEATITQQAASTNQVSATSHEIAATSGQLVKTMDNIAQTAQVTAQEA